MSLGDLIVGWLLLRQAEVALAALDRAAPGRGTDREFYQGKVAAARFFAANVLPRLSAERASAELVQNDLMELSPDAF